MNKIEPRLQYSYATIDLETCECYGCMTYSFEIIDEAYIPVPRARNEYVGTYYSFDTDLWYEDAAMTIEATEVNAMYHC